MSDGYRSGRSAGRVSCKSTELKRCSMTEMRSNKCEYNYTHIRLTALFSGTTHGQPEYQKGTRSSAIADGPRDASCQLKSCQLPLTQQYRNYLYDKS